MSEDTLHYFKASAHLFYIEDQPTLTINANKFHSRKKNGTGWVSKRWSEKEMTQGRGACACVWQAGAKGRETGSKQKTNSQCQPNFQKCENLYKPISSNNRQDWIDEKQRRRRERQSGAIEWTGLPHSLLNFLLHSPLHTVNYWPGIPLPPFHT